MEWKEYRHYGYPAPDQKGGGGLQVGGAPIPISQILWEDKSGKKQEVRLNASQGNLFAAAYLPDWAMAQLCRDPETNEVAVMVSGDKYGLYLQGQNIGRSWMLVTLDNLLPKDCDALLSQLDEPYELVRTPHGRVARLSPVSEGDSPRREATRRGEGQPPQKG